MILVIEIRDQITQIPIISADLLIRPLSFLRWLTLSVISFLLLMGVLLDGNVVLDALILRKGIIILMIFVVVI